MTAVIRRARPEEAPALRELAHRSKAYWPYDAEFLKAVAPMLILEPRHVRTHEVHVLELDGGVAGWHRAVGGEEIGRTPSAAEPGRTLPRMGLGLSDDGAPSDKPSIPFSQKRGYW